MELSTEFQTATLALCVIAELLFCTVQGAVITTPAAAVTPDQYSSNITTVATSSAMGDTTSDTTPSTHYTTCTPHYQEHWCMHGGTCIYFVDEERASCLCPQYWDGNRCHIFEYVYQSGKQDAEEKTIAYTIAGIVFAFSLICVFVAGIVVLLRRRRARNDRTGSEDELAPSSPGSSSLHVNTKLAAQQNGALMLNGATKNGALAC